MAHLRRTVVCASVLLLLGGGVGLRGVQKKTSKTAGSHASASSTPTKAIAVHEYQLEGVDLALTEVTRTAPDTVTVKWEYRNKTNKVQDLATKSNGWSDPYRLSIDSYVMDGQTKIPVMRDSERVPVAAAHGHMVDKISVGPGKTIKTWAKYSVPAATSKITVVITGADPFENVDITEPPSK